MMIDIIITKVIYSLIILSVITLTASTINYWVIIYQEKRSAKEATVDTVRCSKLLWILMIPFNFCLYAIAQSLGK